MSRMVTVEGVSTGHKAPLKRTNPSRPISQSHSPHTKHKNSGVRQRISTHPGGGAGVMATCSAEVRHKISISSHFWSFRDLATFARRSIGQLPWDVFDLILALFSLAKKFRLKTTWLRRNGDLKNCTLPKTLWPAKTPANHPKPIQRVLGKFERVHKPW